jgi:hypothetical protein
MARKLRYLLFLLPLFALAATGGTCRGGNAPQPEEEQTPEVEELPPLQPARNFVAKDIDGRDFSLASLEGRNFILFFFSGSTHKEMDESSLLYAEYIREVIRQLDQGDEPMDFVVVGIQYYHPPNQRELGIAFRDRIPLRLDRLIIDDEDSSVFSVYHVEEIPGVIFCNAQFREVVRITGPQDEEIVQKIVEKWKERYKPLDTLDDDKELEPAPVLESDEEGETGGESNETEQ